MYAYETTPTGTTAGTPGPELQLETPRLKALSVQVSNAITAAHRAGNFILPKSPQDVRDSIIEGRAAVLLDKDGLADYYCQLSPLVEKPHLWTIYELGALIANPNRDKSSGYTAGQTVRKALDLPCAQGKLVLATSRSKPSKNALTAGGMVFLDRRRFPMLDAVTCDPECAPSPSGLAWIACNGRVQCDACVVTSPERPDACYLLVNDAALAEKTEVELNEWFGGNARLLRQTFSLNLG